MMRCAVTGFRFFGAVVLAFAGAHCDRASISNPFASFRDSDASTAAATAAPSAALTPSVAQILFDGGAVTVSRGSLRTTLAFEAMAACSIDAASTVHCLGRRATDLEPIVDHGAIPFYGATAQLAAMNDGLCALSASGRVECIGRGKSGQMGDGALIDRTIPVAVLEGVVELVAGYGHACARMIDGRLACWGDDVRARDGDKGEHTCDSGPCLPSPTFFTLRSAAIAIAAGPRSVCAIEKDGGVECFGSPGSPKTLQPVRDLTLGSSSACALAKTGEVWCWGKNDVTQTGVFGPDIRSDAVRVPLKEKVVEIATAGGSTCARLASGAVSCWGANALGQLGRGKATPVIGSSPGPVLLASPARALAGGGAFCAATDHAVTCWGPRPWTAVPAKSINDPSVDGRDFASKPVEVSEFAGASGH